MGANSRLGTYSNKYGRWKHTHVRVKVPPHQNSFILIIKKANTIPFQNNVINKKVTVQT